MKYKIKKKSTSVTSVSRARFPVRRSARLANRQASSDVKTICKKSLLVFTAHNVTCRSFPLHEIRNFSLPPPLRPPSSSVDDAKHSVAHSPKTPLVLNSPDSHHSIANKNVPDNYVNIDVASKTTNVLLVDLCLIIINVHPTT